MNSFKSSHILILINLIFLLGFSAFGQKIDLQEERKHFDFLIGEWKVKKSIILGEVVLDNKDLYKFKKSLDGNAIIAEWYINRGTKDKPDYANALYVSGFDNSTGKWSFYYISHKSAHYYDSKKLNGDWYFYRKFNFRGEDILQRQVIKPVDDKTALRIIENSKDSGKTWKRIVELIMKKV